MNTLTLSRAVIEIGPKNSTILDQGNLTLMKSLLSRMLTTQTQYSVMITDVKGAKVWARKTVRYTPTILETN